MTTVLGAYARGKEHKLVGVDTILTIGSEFHQPT